VFFFRRSQIHVKLAPGKDNEELAVDPVLGDETREKD